MDGDEKESIVADLKLKKREIALLNKLDPDVSVVRRKRIATRKYTKVRRNRYNTERMAYIENRVRKMGEQPLDNLQELFKDTFFTTAMLDTFKMRAKAEGNVVSEQCRVHLKRLRHENDALMRRLEGLPERTGQVEDKVIGPNQESVYAIARLHATGKLKTPGLLVKHGTGSGKTLIAVTILLAFWDATTADGRYYSIFFVSSIKNQRSDNNMDKLAQLCIDYFSGWVNQREFMYAAGDSTIKIDPNNTIFSNDFYLAHKSAVHLETHLDFVKSLIMQRITRGQRDTFVRTDAWRSFFDRRRNKDSATKDAAIGLYTFGTLGFDFFKNMIPEDQTEVNQRGIALQAKMQEIERNHMIQTIMKCIETWMQTSSSRAISKLKECDPDEGRNDITDSVFEVWNAMYDARTRVFKPMLAKNPTFLEFLEHNNTSTVENTIQAFRNVLHRLFSIEYVMGPRARRGEPTNDKYICKRSKIVQYRADEEEVDEEEDTSSSSSEEEHHQPADLGILQKLNDDYGGGEDEGFIRFNAHGLIENAVFIVDESQLLFDVPPMELMFHKYYYAFQMAMKYYRDPSSTFMYALTATPGFNNMDIANLMLMLDPEPDVVGVQPDEVHRPIPQVSDIEITTASGDIKRVTMHTRGMGSYRRRDVSFTRNSRLRFLASEKYNVETIASDVLANGQGLVSFVDFSGDLSSYPQVRVELVRSHLHDDDIGSGAVDEKGRPKDGGLMEVVNHFHELCQSHDEAQAVRAKKEYYGPLARVKDGVWSSVTVTTHADAHMIRVPKNNVLRRYRRANLFTRLREGDSGELDRFIQTPVAPPVDIDALRKRMSEFEDDDLLESFYQSCVVNVSHRDSVVTYRPSQKMVDVVRNLLTTVHGNLTCGKQYVYCFDMFSLQMIAWLLHKMSGGRLVPYRGETFEELYDDARGYNKNAPGESIRRFYFTDTKRSERLPFRDVGYAKLASECKNGFTPAQVQSLGKQFASSDLLLEEVERMIPVNIEGDLIPIILATGESYKGVDMKGIRAIHLVDSFVDLQDFFQLLGRAPRMCSHVYLTPTQRNAVVRVYHGTGGTHDFGDNRAITDPYLWNRAVEAYKQDWVPLENAFVNVAIDKLVFDPFHRNVKKLTESILHLTGHRRVQTPPPRPAAETGPVKIHRDIKTAVSDELRRLLAKRKYTRIGTYYYKFEKTLYSCVTDESTRITRVRVCVPKLNATCSLRFGFEFTLKKELKENIARVAENLDKLADYTKRFEMGLTKYEEADDELAAELDALFDKIERYLNEVIHKMRETFGTHTPKCTEDGGGDCAESGLTQRLTTTPTAAAAAAAADVASEG